MRLSAGDVLSLVAGSLTATGMEDGPGSSALFNSIHFLCSDDAGSVFVADGHRVRRIALPAAWRASANGAAAATLEDEAAEATDVDAGAAAEEGVGAAGMRAAAASRAPGAAGSQPRPEPQVSTVLALDQGTICGLAWCGFTSSLIYSTGSALFRLPLAAPSPAAAGDDAVATPVLLCGRQDELGEDDGAAGVARFHDAWGMVMEQPEGDERVGAVIVTDRREEAGTTGIRRVAPDGTVTTLARVIGTYCRPSILPCGYLVVSADDDTGGIVVLDMGLNPQRLCAPAAAAAAGPPPRTLPADLGALLDRQPDGSADLKLQVGDRTFHAHRLILSSRSDYFQQRLGGDFADASAAQITLPDADPEAFALLLRWIYTGAVDVPAAAAQAVAELADRLLLPELCRTAQAQVLAGVSAETVVGALLWAEARGAGFASLLSDLKAWYLENQRAVLRRARNSLKRLAAECPDLMVELHELAVTKRSRLE